MTDALPPETTAALAEAMRHRNGNKHDDQDRREVTLVAASTVRPQVTRWAWADRVPLGALTLVVGQEGSGKTTLVLTLIAEATRGTLAGDLLGQPVSAVFATAEDSWSRTLVPRLIAAGADLDRVHFVRVDGLAGGLTVPGDLDSLTDAMRDAGAVLLALDPLGAHFHASTDTHRDASVRQALAPLAGRMDQLGAAAIGLMHWSKGATTVALDRVNGSRAFTAAARCLLATGVDPDDQDGRVILVAKSNLGRLDVPALRYRLDGVTIEADDLTSIATSRLVWTGEALGLRSSDLLGAPLGDEERSAIEEAKGFLLDQLNPDAKPAHDVKKAAEHEGITNATLRRAKTALGVESVKEGKPGEQGRWLWRLRDGVEGAHDIPKVPSHRDTSTFGDVEHLRGREGASSDSVTVSEAERMALVLEAFPGTEVEPEPLVDIAGVVTPAVTLCAWTADVCNRTGTVLVAKTGKLYCPEHARYFA